jgi:hypothetical protein
LVSNNWACNEQTEIMPFVEELEVGIISKVMPLKSLSIKLN